MPRQSYKKKRMRGGNVMSWIKNKALPWIKNKAVPYLRRTQAISKGLNWAGNTFGNPYLSKAGTVAGMVGFGRRRRYGGALRMAGGALRM